MKIYHLIIKYIEIFFLVVLSSILVFYIVLWLFSFSSKPADFGISYSPQYASYLGLDPHAAYDSIISELKPKYVRLAVPWTKTEPVRGYFDFSESDYFVNKASESDAKVTLVIGQKIPRWPECYIPNWAKSLDTESRKKVLLEYVKATVDHYKNNPAVDLWQVENEPFIIFNFGECADYDQNFVSDEVSLVRATDPSRNIVMTDSGELSTWAKPAKLGDILGTTIYRTVRTPGGSLFSYDWLPAAFYKLKARVWGKDSTHFFVSELQAEPWFSGPIPRDRKSADAEKSFSPERMLANVNYAKKVGASRVYLWGAEWWYFMKTKIGDDRYWDTAKTIF